MDVKKPIYCSLAFGSASINSYGEYIPCCNIRVYEWGMYKDRNTELSNILNQKSPKDRINAGNLRQLRRQLMKGEWPSVCYNCKEAEDAGVASMRNIWNRSLPEEIVPMVEHVDNKNIYYLDLTFSTKCNSKCMTCGPALSDFWEEEHTIIWELKDYQKEKYQRICIDDTTAQKIVEDFPNVENISFVGGEPTISEEHIRFLNLLVDSGRSKNIKLNYVTNLTGYNDEMVLLWKNFKSVFVSVSIDGYDKVNDYIRYPIKWSKCEQNVRRFLEMVRDSFNSKDPDKTEFSIGLSCTISMFNAIQSIDLFEFWFDTLTEYKTNKSTLAEHVGCFVNRVSSPIYTKVGLLSNEYRQRGIDKGKNLLDKIDNYIQQNPSNVVNKGIIDSIKLTMSWLEDEEITHPTIHANNKHLIHTSDEFRNRKLQDYIPELYEELQKVWGMYAKGPVKL